METGSKRSYTLVRNLSCRRLGRGALRADDAFACQERRDFRPPFRRAQDAASAPSLEILVVPQFLAGGAWAAVLPWMPVLAWASAALLLAWRVARPREGLASP